jgi:hypothetical protein
VDDVDRAGRRHQRWIFAGSLAMARLSKVARTNQEMADFYNNSPTLG